MELSDTTISKLDKHTAALKSNDIQVVLLAWKKRDARSEHLPDYQNNILEKLWFHLKNGLQEFDDQLLCSVCFFTALNKSSSEEFYLKQIYEIVQNELGTKDDTLKLSKISLAISLSYGIFQSSYILQHVTIPAQPFTDKFGSTVEAVFQLLTRETYKYTQYTFVAFKILTSLKKIYSSSSHMILMNQNNMIKLLNLINHNWENPITGIRNLNGIVFRNLLSFLNNDKDTYETIIKEINGFYWNKAKYLMLAEIIEQTNEIIEDLISKNNWLDGLVYSLSKPGLVSAGADMYNAILKRINSTTIWTEIFLNKFMYTLKGNCDKLIQNFSSYWCLNTLKKFPSLSQVLIKEINHIDDSEQKLLFIMNVMKQSNKLGLLDYISENIAKTRPDLYEVNSIVLFSLEHSNVSVRMLAFEIICLHQQKCLPSDIVYKHVLKFLTDNVNSDCTVLRISMINNLSIFLTKVLTLFLNTTQTNCNEDIHKLVIFCQNLQDFVVESLGLDGNYQRKITSVKIAYTIFKCLSEVPRKKREQIRKTNTSLIDFLKENGHWKINSNDFIMTLLNLMKDPAKDVNEGVLQLLSEYYFEELSEPLIISLLIDEGLKCIASKFFYEISCGQTIFKLIINVLSKNNKIECMFKNVEDIFNFAYKEISLEYTSKRGIVKSIENGKQLHSFLAIVSLIFDASIKKSYVINISEDTISSLLDIVEHISNQFVWEEDLSTSSDFSKMSEMVQTMIKTSEIECQNGEDKTQISGLYQIVLNCLWLNVKASCELASLLIQCYNHDKNICQKCLNIIVNVLETSRHKGAIEAAGATLGVAIQFLTSLSEELEVSKLPFDLLKKKLKELLLETAKMSSVTRRGAGLSIMVHRIVSNDLQKGKPLFHYFIKTLLDTCKNFDDSCSNEGVKDIDNEMDLPKAIYIHLLTRIVTDSSLASDTMFYSAELAALAFDNLSDNHWQIRNAALQLYGALIPKLIGQKKASGIDEETVATVGCDEFRTHSPKLWNYIMQQIQNVDYKDVIQAHSNLVPILNVLASLTKRYNFSYDLYEQEKSESNLLPYLITLLGSPIYTVRRLTAQCICNIYKFKTINDELSKLNNCVTENYLHGSIILLSNLYKTYANTELIQLECLTRNYESILVQKKTSFICKWSLEKILSKPEEVKIATIQNILLTVDNNRHKPGVSLWGNLKMEKYLQNMSWGMIPETLGLLVKSQEFELYSESLINRIKDDTDPPKDVLVETVQLLLTSDQMTKSSELWKLVYCISLKIDLDPQYLNISQLSPYITQTPYKLRYIIPFVAKLMVKQKNNENLLFLSKSIFSLSNPNKNDVDMRNIAALGNNEFGNELHCFTDDVTINVIKSAVILLQDEDEDIRNLSVKFYENVQNETKHPFICLNKILSKGFLYKVFKEPESCIQRICKDLSDFVDSIRISKDNEYNPFSSDSKNIYLETKLFREILENISETCT